jgi:hypothetical protein
MEIRFRFSRRQFFLIGKQVPQREPKRNILFFPFMYIEKSSFPKNQGTHYAQGNYTNAKWHPNFKPEKALCFKPERSILSERSQCNFISWRKKGGEKDAEDGGQIGQGAKLQLDKLVE